MYLLSESACGVCIARSTLLIHVTGSQPHNKLFNTFQHRALVTIIAASTPRLLFEDNDCNLCVEITML